MTLDRSPRALSAQVKRWAKELGFSGVAITGTDLGDAEARLLAWLDKGWHGAMDYMACHGVARARPAHLVPGTLSIITVRLDYWPAQARDALDTLSDADAAYVSRYALGRDYHKVLRSRLQSLADRLTETLGEFAYRAFTDSAPVMEVAIAARAGLGWQGKHTLLLSREAGSLHFLGELLVGLELEPDAPVENHCGTCERCLDACPTRAIVAPYQLDARRCISYLTIENPGPIPRELRKAMGNRIYGCDDCQLACPWNKYATTTSEPDFAVRHGLDGASLASLLAWTEAQFNAHLEGSAIRRIGHARWLRNIAVALGNAHRSPEVIAALQARADYPDAMVREHVQWALAQHEAA